MKKYLIIVDTQNDFINGSLACKHEPNLLKKIANLTARFDLGNVFYTLDYHSLNHISLKKNGGIWPNHCIQNTYGSLLHEELLKIDNPNKPNDNNMFYKGQVDEKEEYSGFLATNKKGLKLSDVIEPNSTIYVVGFAVEYCCLETAKDFATKGFKTFLLHNYCGYVTEEGKSKCLDNKINNLTITTNF